LKKIPGIELHELESRRHRCANQVVADKPIQFERVYFGQWQHFLGEL
jgi:hypothetical protein